MPTWTVEEAARELGYKTGTVYQKIYRGQIRARHIGRAVRIFEADNEALFAERRELLREDAKKQRAPKSDSISDL